MAHESTAQPLSTVAPCFRGLIYCVTNIVNGKQYVGQTVVSLAQRRRQHTSAAKCGFEHGRLYVAMRKHGVGTFAWSVLQGGIENQTELNEAEIHWIETLGTYRRGYNASKGGDRPPKADETRAKISSGLKGRKLSSEHRAKISAFHRGRKASSETRAKLSAARIGKTRPPAVREKISAAKKGAIFSSDHREKISAALLGKALSSETRAKIGTAHRGRTLAPEHVAKVIATKAANRASGKRYKKHQERTPEHRAKMSANMKGRKLSAESIAKRQATRAAKRLAQQGQDRPPPPDLLAARRAAGARGLAG